MDSASSRHLRKRQKRQTSPAIRTGRETFIISSTHRSQELSSSNTPLLGRDLMELLCFLHQFGLDTRIGLLCCAPAIICKQPCLLVSLRLVGIVAKAFLPKDDLFRRTSLSHLTREPGELRRICTKFFPFDPEMDIRRAAERHLPLCDPQLATSKNIHDDLYPLDLRYITACWKGKSQEPHQLSAATILNKMDKIVRTAHFVEASPLMLRADRAQNNELVTFGHSVPREAVDVAACRALYDASTSLNFSEGFHICCGWRQVDARLRSAVEIEHDDWLGFSVGAAELKADRSVPFPSLNLSSKSPLAPLACFPKEANDLCTPLARRVEIIAEWLANDGEASRIFELTAGRAFADESPGIEALGRLRAMASLSSARPP